MTPTSLGAIRAVRGTLLALGIATLAATNLGVAEATAQDSDFDRAVALHDAARDGDAAATPKAVKAFEALVKADGNNALAVAYLGSTYAITARDSSNVVNRMRYANRGLRQLDAAVEMDPNHFLVRVIRANVTVRLPAMFGRKDSTIADMKILDETFSREKDPGKAASMANIYGFLADIAPDDGDWKAKADEARALAGN